jgi:hypothetical protein
MAKAFKISHGAAAAMLGDGTTRGLGEYIAGGSVSVYPGVAPEACDDPVGLAPALIEFALPDPVFADAIDEVLEAMSIPSSTAVAAGLAAWWRASTSSGGPACQGTAGDPDDDADLTLSDKRITFGAIVAITRWLITQHLG